MFPASRQPNRKVASLSFGARHLRIRRGDFPPYAARGRSLGRNAELNNVQRSTLMTTNHLLSPERGSEQCSVGTTSESGGPSSGGGLYLSLKFRLKSSSGSQTELKF
jgi:hypothetical protein